MFERECVVCVFVCDVFVCVGVWESMNSRNILLEL